METTTPVSPTPNFARAVGRNTIVQFVGKLISTILGFATSILILRYLHVDGNGSYTTAMAYLGFFSVVADLGLYLILVRDIHRPGANIERIVGNLLALRWVSVAIILLGGAAIVSFFGFSHQENIAVLIGTGSFIAIAATQLLVGVFQSKLAMIYIAGGEILGRVILLAGTWWVVSHQGSLYAIMVTVVLSSLTNFLFVFYSSRKYIHFQLYFDWAYWKSTLRDTLPIAISIVLNLIYFRADTILLRMMKGTYDVGLYGAAYKILEILNTFPLMFVGLLLPALGSAFASNDQVTFQRIFQKGFTFIFLAIVPLLIGGWVLAEPTLILIGKQEYAPAAPVLRLLLLAVAALYMGSLSGHVITIINRQRQMVWSYLSVAVLGLVLYLTLIPRFSLYGAAVGTIITETVTAVVGYIIILRVMKFRLELRAIPKILFAGLLMYSTITLMAHLNIWLAVGLGGIVYLSALFLTKVVSTHIFNDVLGRNEHPTKSVTHSQ